MLITRYSAFVLVACIFIGGCNSSTNNESLGGDDNDHPDLAKEEHVTTPARNGESDLALRNTVTFHTIEIKQMKFQPDELRLHKGDTVLWINRDITDHDVTEETNKTWTSSRLSAGKSWSKVVTESADYFCSLHLVMKGKLIVTE
ncbi:MAG TPA: plastocyanin/azurin family copper-binding protein [Cyclobacteriaceae bacterium]|nr:plastocyanin/azurin family copper-binding protein [Cyclobacteriaceae bacterium]